MSKVISGLTEGWWMFFDTFWALIFGFILSGAVQAFVSKSQMQSALGDRRPKTIGKASFFGAVSSSCSYAASALAKSLFAKGADFTASMIFMFASTNLVIELGLVLWILIGWQFAAAEFVGGAVMILLLWILLPRLVPEKMVAASRSMVEVPDSMEMASGESISTKIKSRRAWGDAAGYTIGDFTMLRTELVVGFIVAGLASTLVSVSAWRSLFISGHGFLSEIENAIIGPVLAFISFVCSVGNVPLAAALWKGGITFGGVIAFIFADLVAFPLVMIYRKYYGTRLAIRLTLVFWLVMAVSGLVTEEIFKVFSLIPHRHMDLMAMKHFGWNSTTFLNVVALIAAGVIYWLYKSQDQASEDSEYAKDLVCGMQVRKSDAPAVAELDGVTYYFCMVGCKEALLATPEKYIK